MLKFASRMSGPAASRPDVPHDRADLSPASLEPPARRSYRVDSRSGSVELLTRADFAPADFAAATAPATVGACRAGPVEIGAIMVTRMPRPGSESITIRPPM